MTTWHVRPMDLHSPGEHCNSYDCSSVVMKYDYDKAVKLLQQGRGYSSMSEQGYDVYAEEIWAWEAAVDAFLGIAEGKPDVPR